MISDLKRMGEWSPQCKKMIVRGQPIGVGTRTININRRGPLVWPTTAKIVRFVPNKELAFKIAENRTVWSYTIDESANGVTVTERRDAANGTSKVSAFLVDKVFGGNDSFETELKGHGRHADENQARRRSGIGQPYSSVSRAGRSASESMMGRGPARTRRAAIAAARPRGTSRSAPAPGEGGGLSAEDVVVHVVADHHHLRRIEVHQVAGDAETPRRRLADGLDLAARRLLQSSR